MPSFSLSFLSGHTALTPYYSTRVFIMDYLYEVPEMRAISTFANILPI